MPRTISENKLWYYLVSPASLCIGTMSWSTVSPRNLPPFSPFCDGDGTQHSRRRKRETEKISCRSTWPSVTRPRPCSPPPRCCPTPLGCPGPSSSATPPCDACPPGPAPCPTRTPWGRSWRSSPGRSTTTTTGSSSECACVHGFASLPERQVTSLLFILVWEQWKRVLSCINGFGGTSGTIRRIWCRCCCCCFYHTCSCFSPLLNLGWYLLICAIFEGWFCILWTRSGSNFPIYSQIQFLFLLSFISLSSGPGSRAWPSASRSSPTSPTRSTRSEEEMRRKAKRPFHISKKCDA